MNITTEAGERLLAFLRRQAGKGTSRGATSNGILYAVECIERSLPDIEAEAREQGMADEQAACKADEAYWRAAECARIAEAVRELPEMVDTDGVECVGGVDRAAVLALLEPTDE